MVRSLVSMSDGVWGNVMVSVMPSVVSRKVPYQVVMRAVVMGGGWW